MIKKCLTIFSLIIFALEAQNVEANQSCLTTRGKAAVENQIKTSCTPDFPKEPPCKQRDHQSLSKLTIEHKLKAGSLEVKNSGSIGYNLSVGQHLNVVNDVVVGGNSVINGTVTASEFITPSGPLFGGLRNYAVLAHQDFISPLDAFNAYTFVWPSNLINISSGISVDNAGNITLPIQGLFLVQYTVKISLSPFNSVRSAVIQLQQTVAGTPTNIDQSAITTNSSTADTDSSIDPQRETQITGYALISTSSNQNNVLSLTVTLAGNNIKIPLATGLDANAQLMIMQIN